MCLTQAVCLNHGACVLPKVLRNVCLHCLTDMVVCVLPRHSVCAYPSWCVLPMVRVSYPWCVCLSHGAFACLTHAHGACVFPMVCVSYPRCVCMSYPCPWCVCLTHGACACLTNAHGACVLPMVRVSYPRCMCLTHGACVLPKVCVTYGMCVSSPSYTRYIQGMCDFYMY